MSTNTHELSVDLHKTDLLIAECRYQLECQYRVIANLRRQRVLAWRQKLRARDMETHISALCTHRDALIRAVAAEQQSAAGAHQGMATEHPRE